MPHIQLPAIRIYYEERGEGAPLLCVHGTGSSGRLWEAAGEELARLGRVILYDRRGCTRSQRPRPYRSTTVSEHAGDAAALLEALAATPAIVIGRSYGGEVAIDLALRYPHCVRALVLLEGAPLGLSPAARRWEAALTARVLAAAEGGIDRVGEALLREVLGDAAWDQFPPPVQEMFTANGPAILAECRGGGLPVDPARLATIDKPALLVAATGSLEAFQEATAALAATLPRGRTAIVGGNHLVDPAGPAVLDFIREVLTSAGGASASTRRHEGGQQRQGHAPSPRSQRQVEGPREGCDA
jgi:pimeloyl-ACP methyl ester carboxylesterase